MPDQIYSTDITELKYNHKKAYLAAVKDLGTKEIVAFKVSDRIDIELTNTAIDRALRRLKEKKLEKCKDLSGVVKEVTKKIRYYNEKRPQLGLKKMPPREYRRHLNF